MSEEKKCFDASLPEKSRQVHGAAAHEQGTSFPPPKPPVYRHPLPPTLILS